MVMPGGNGWEYMAGDASIRSHSLDALYTAVEKFRAENNIPTGDVIGDVNAQICGRFPNNCNGYAPGYEANLQIAVAQTKASYLLEDVQMWAAGVLKTEQRYALVANAEAERRAMICQSCPNNTSWRGCKTCGHAVSATERVCASIRQARDTKTSQNLGGCMKLRHDNQTAVFLDKDILQKAQGLPANCWAQ